MSTDIRRRSHRQRVPPAAEADVIVIGSGYGGAMAARAALRSGSSVIMVERGQWVQRESAWAQASTLELSSAFAREYARGETAGASIGTVRCVGGASVYAGGVATRYRREDFDARPETDWTAWPYGYADLEPHYAEAERLLGVAGRAGEDPTEPPRSTPYPVAPAPLAPVAARIEQAARRTGHRPHRLPLAFNQGTDRKRAACVSCGTCDTFACAISAKNDVAASLIAPLVARGLDLRTGVEAIRIRATRGQVTGVDCSSARGDIQFRAPRVVLAGGALPSAHLLLSSGLDRHNPSGHLVGRYLMRHCSTILMGIFPRRLEGIDRFHKQIGVHDGYWDGPDGGGRAGGSLQQVGRPPTALLAQHLPTGTRWAAGALGEHLTGLLAIAEDQPRAGNRIRLDSRRRDRAGRPAGVVEHSYSARDLAARERLIGRGRAILRAAGAIGVYRHDIDTFSHAVGTVRFGRDPETSPLDEDCRFRGIDGLYVMDGSVLPTSAGVNPSLTIAATAHRAAQALARDCGATETRRLRSVDRLAA